MRYYNLEAHTLKYALPKINVFYITNEKTFFEYTPFFSQIMFTRVLQGKICIL
jgi:hypothetical protein